MGRAQQRPTKPKKSGHKQKKQKDGSGVASPAVLLDRAQEAIARDDYETALSLLQKATEIAPNNCEVCDTYGCLLAECGQAEKAAEVLRHSIAISPDEGHEKYLYLGQLLESEGALQSVAKGIDIIERKLSNLSERANGEEGTAGEDEWEVDELSGQLSRALCSQAEVLLASSSSIEEVADEVEMSLMRAEDIDPTNPEPMQVLCSLRVEQGRPDEALAALRKSTALWFKPENAAEEGRTGPDAADKEEPLPGEAAPEEDDDDSEMDDMDGELPSYEFRLETAKLLLELEATTLPALQVVVSLLNENDSVPDTWQMYAMCLHASGQFEDALKAVEDGRTLCSKLGMPPDDVVIQSFSELEESIKDSMGSAP
mmetsp:Transcript_33690/g.95305  ORF Transcript_33690/g.95305 Transcript_33690/m.95305 type:complete len:371 (+) Transcript_33690:356-1468(+)